MDDNGKMDIYLSKNYGYIISITTEEEYIKANRTIGERLINNNPINKFEWMIIEHNLAIIKSYEEANPQARKELKEYYEKQ